MFSTGEILFPIETFVIDSAKCFESSFNKNRYEIQKSGFRKLCYLGFVNSRYIIILTVFISILVHIYRET